MVNDRIEYKKEGEIKQSLYVYPMLNIKDKSKEEINIYNEEKN